MLQTYLMEINWPGAHFPPFRHTSISAEEMERGTLYTNESEIFTVVAPRDRIENA